MTWFYLTITENFKRFQYFDFETNFLENENLFKKAVFWKIWSKIENALFPSKTAISVANVKTSK